MTGIAEIDRTSLVIQCTRLEASRRAADYRLAVWTALAFACGVACGMAAVWL